MIGRNRKRALITSGAIVLLCLTIVVGMTWALFTDTQTVQNHLKAGDLAITLKRVELVKTTLNSEGYLVESDPYKKVINFTNPTDENVFGLDTDSDGKVTEKIVPGSKFIATMRVENNSDAAFGYWIEIVCKDQSNGEDLAKQLKVTVNTGKDNSAFVADGLKVGGPKPNSYVGEVGVGKGENFTVTVEFVDQGFNFNGGVLSSPNDSAQTEDLKFDLVVYAVQLTEPTTP